MNNRKEALMDAIRTAGVPTDADRKELEKALQIPAVQRALFAILTGSDDAVIALTNGDFTTDAGVKAAILLQAKARCYSAVVEDVVEFATTEPQPEEKPKEKSNDNPS